MSLPPELSESLRAYADDGRPLGGFLEAVVSNDLVLAAMRADHLNRELLFDLAGYVYNDMPATCWGSRRIYELWIVMHRARRVGDAEGMEVRRRELEEEWRSVRRSRG